MLFNAILICHNILEVKYMNCMMERSVNQPTQWIVANAADLSTWPLVSRVQICCIKPMEELNTYPYSLWLRGSTDKWTICETTLCGGACSSLVPYLSAITWVPHHPSPMEKDLSLPVPKKPCPKENDNNFRPVALTSIVMKCFEKYMVSLLKHISKS